MGKKATLINPRFASGVDRELLDRGFIKKFYDGMSAKDALEESRITPDCIAQDIINGIKA